MNRTNKIQSLFFALLQTQRIEALHNIVVNLMWNRALRRQMITITPEMTTLFSPASDVPDKLPLHVAPDFGVEHGGEVELYIERCLRHL